MPNPLPQRPLALAAPALLALGLLTFGPLTACSSEGAEPSSSEAAERGERAHGEPVSEAHGAPDEHAAGDHEGADPAAGKEPGPGDPDGVAPDEPAQGPDGEPEAAALTGEAALAALRAHVATIAAREEHTDPQVEVSHVLVSFQGAGVGSKRTKEEAEQLAAEILSRALTEGGFEALRKEHTEDPGPRIYKMAPKPAAGVYARSGMVAAFGDVGWRLAPGEIGVAAFDPKTSPYGWHIIKRIR